MLTGQYRSVKNRLIMWILQLLLGSSPENTDWAEAAGFPDGRSPWAHLTFEEYDEAVPLALKDIEERKAKGCKDSLRAARLIWITSNLPI